MLEGQPKGSFFRNSQYLQALYQKSKKAQTPFFTINSSNLRIIQDPLDFYLLLKKSISQSTKRVGLSCLYLSNGPLETHLLDQIAQRHKAFPSLHSVLAFDLNRSKRQQNGQSPMETLTKWSQQIGSQSKVSFLKVGFGTGVIGQVLGVHHQKIYVFDDKVILTGANLSKTYFLNRRDRCILIQSPELSDYLYSYLELIAQNSNIQHLKVQYKAWKKTHMPRYYCSSFSQQFKELNQMKFHTIKQRSELPRMLFQNLAMNTHTSQLNNFQQLQNKKQLMRNRLQLAKSKEQVQSCFQDLNQNFTPSVLDGKDVYIFPFIQWTSINQNMEYDLFSEILNLAANSNHLIRLTSGYLNLDSSLLQKAGRKSQLNCSLKLLCSAPEANSFFKAGGFKSYVPIMYRCYEWELLKKLQKKVDIKQFSNGKWSFHAKGIWVQQAQNSYLSIIGSSNFGERSKNRDSQFQFYLYSNSSQLNTRLNEEWSTLQKDCKSVSLKQIEEDSQTRVNLLHSWLSKLASSIL